MDLTPLKKKKITNTAKYLLRKLHLIKCSVPDQKFTNNMAFFFFFFFFFFLQKLGVVKLKSFIHLRNHTYSKNSFTGKKQNFYPANQKSPLQRCHSLASKFPELTFAEPFCDYKTLKGLST